MVVGLVCTLHLSAQNKISDYPKMEIGLSLGITEYLGDLGGSNGKGKRFIIDTDWQYTRPLLGIYYKHHFKNWLALSANLNWTRVKGDDAATTYDPREQRGLSFSTRILELYGMAHFTPFTFGGGKYKLYGMGGLGIFSFNKTEHESVQDTPNYSSVQIMMPVGLGFSYQINYNWVLSSDLMHRVTFTDYIDGYSYSSPTQRKQNDSFYSLMFKVGYILDKTAGFGRNNIGCPNTKF